MKRYSLIILVLHTAIVPAVYAHKYYRSNQQRHTESSQQLPMQPHRVALQRLSKFCKPINYTHSGIKCWTKHTYNDPRYDQKFLPFNLNHLEDFLTQTTYNEQPRLYAQSVLKLFTQKVKSTPFMNSYSLEEYLTPILHLLTQHFDPCTDHHGKKREIKKCVYTYLLQEFATLKHNPDEALDMLSEQILQTLNKHRERDLSILELQYTVKAFLELVLSKLIWHSAESHYIWPNVKNIASQLEQYEAHNVITPEMLDELFWTLLYRCAYFIELNTPELPETFYMAILQDIDTRDDLFWTLEEQEDFITTKKEYFRRSLITSNIASKALRSGLMATES